MARIHDAVLASFVERMTADERVTDSLAEKLRDSFNHEEAPSGDVIVALIREESERAGE